MQTKIELSFPSVNYTPPDNALLSVLQADLQTHWGTICENFVEMIGEDVSWMEFRWFHLWSNYRTLDIARVPRVMLPADIVVDGLKYFLNTSYAVLMNVDTFYISAYKNAHLHHLAHELFIYGCDEREQVFYCRDYFDYTNYKQALVPYQELKNSQVDYCFKDYLNGALLLKAKEVDELPYASFVWENLYKGLLTLVNPLKKDEAPDQWYGFHFFQPMGNALMENPKAINIRSVHFIVVHIKLMKLRVELLCAKFPYIPKKLLSDIELLTQKALLFEKLMLKYSLKSGLLSDEIHLCVKAHEILLDIETNYYTFVWDLIRIVEG